MVKNLPAKQEIQVHFLGQENTLEKGMAAHSSTLAWRIPWTVEVGGLSPWCPQRVRYNKATNTLTFRELRSHMPFSRVPKQ